MSSKQSRRDASYSIPCPSFSGRVGRAKTFAAPAFLPAVLALAAMGTTVHATEIVYEGFDYPASTDLNTLDGGAGWTAAWSGAAGVRQVQEPGATKPDLSRRACTAMDESGRATLLY